METHEAFVLCGEVDVVFLQSARHVLPESARLEFGLQVQRPHALAYRLQRRRVDQLAFSLRMRNAVQPSV